MSRPARNGRHGAPIRSNLAQAAPTGDIGTRYNLGCFVSGLELAELSADLDSFVPGRQLDDNGHIMLRYKGGAKGMIWVQPGRTGQ